MSNPITHACFVLLILSMSTARAQQADWVIAGGRIYTMDPQRPAATSMAIREGRIVAVGDDVSAHMGPRTRRTDLRGRTVVPGFIDAHAHLHGLGQMLETLDFRGAITEQEVAQRVAEATGRARPGEWILGRNWDQSLWPGGEFPTLQSLTQAAPRHPVYLTRVDGHAGWANRLALELAGIARDTPDPPGGRILRLADGEPSGVLIDRAQDLVRAKIPEPGREQVLRRLRAAARECVRWGLTGIHDAGVGPAELDALRTLAQRAELPLRVYAMIGGAGPLWEKYLERGPETGDWLTVRSIKLVADGAMGSRGAALLEAYADEPRNTGLLILDEEALERIARQAYDRGFQVNTHAIGDRANRAVLGAYQAVLRGENDRRFRVEHAQLVAPDDFARFKQLSLIASMQATHATSDMRWAEERLGRARLAGAYAWRRFLDLGVRIANGSDFPVEKVNPLLGFYAAITRQDPEGAPPGGWLPDQRMTREEALRSWTLDAAYAAFEEDRKGSLAPGKLADFVVLSRDIMECEPADILTAEAVMTVVGGKVVYERAR